MENVTDIYTGPFSPDSRYIKPFTIHYKQVGDLPCDLCCVPFKS